MSSKNLGPHNEKGNIHLHGELNVDKMYIEIIGVYEWVLT